MNETTNKRIEEYLKSNRYIRYDEIDFIMQAVDKLTDWIKPNNKKKKEEPPLKAFFFMTFEKVPLWMMGTIFILGLIFGKYGF